MRASVAAAARNAAKALTTTVRTNAARLEQTPAVENQNQLKASESSGQPSNPDTSRATSNQNTSAFASLKDPDTATVELISGLRLEPDDEKLSLEDLAAEAPDFVDGLWRSYARKDQRLILRACIHWRKLVRNLTWGASVTLSLTLDQDTRIAHIKSQGTDIHKSTHDPWAGKPVFTLEARNASEKRLSTYHLHDDETYNVEHKRKAPKMTFDAPVLRTREPEELPEGRSEKTYSTKLADKPVSRRGGSADTSNGRYTYGIVVDQKASTPALLVLGSATKKLVAENMVS